MINLNHISTKAPDHLDKDAIKEQTKNLQERMGELQELLFAEGKRGLLIVLQGLDGSGKSGAVKKVFDCVNPMGIRVKSFKGPTPEKKAPDFLWRVHAATPAKGMIQVFDRSHYEEVLITRVEGWVDDAKAAKRFEILNNFEQLLINEGTMVFKFYLHISKDEQQERFYDRLVDPQKHWKFGMEDLRKAQQWNDYIRVYNDCLTQCGPNLPWHIVPSDQNWYKEFYILNTLVTALEKLNLQYPPGEIDYENPEVKAIINKFDGKKKSK